jgi:hypothetical protein
MIIDNEDFKCVETKYPHIAKQIMLLWGSFEMNIFFDNILEDTRKGTRLGFPSKDSECLYRLREKHYKLFSNLLNIKKENLTHSENSSI